MKKYAMLAMVGLLYMGPTVQAQDPQTDHQTGVESTKKEIHKKHMAKNHKSKHLTAKERKNLDKMQQTGNPPSEQNLGETQVK